MESKGFYKVNIVVERVNNPLIKKHYKKFIIKSINLTKNEHSGIQFNNIWHKDNDETLYRVDIEKKNKILHFISSNYDKKVKAIVVEDFSFLGSFYCINVGDVVTDKELKKLEKLISLNYTYDNIININT